MQVTVGDKIPLWLQVFDARDDLNPRVKLIDDNGKQFAEVLLNHFGGGLYLNKEIDMPDETNFVIAQYHVYKDLQPVDDYEVTTDFYYAVPKEQAPVKFVTGRVVSSQKIKGMGRIINEASNS